MTITPNTPPQGVNSSRRESLCSVRVLTLANRDKSMLDVETAPRVAAPGAQVGASVKAQPQVQASHPTDHGTVSDEERARMVRASHENAPQAEGFSPRARQVGWEKRPRARRRPSPAASRA
jgi:hypothetical protein